jgi:hypothetical protein
MVGLVLGNDQGFWVMAKKEGTPREKQTGDGVF